jgi:hypothetical protein
MANKKDKKLKNKNSNNKKPVVAEEIPILKNPTNSILGKIFIWILLFGFIGLLLISAIVLLIQTFF